MHISFARPSLVPWPWQSPSGCPSRALEGVPWAIPWVFAIYNQKLSYYAMFSKFPCLRYLLWSPQCALNNLYLIFCCPSCSILKLRGSHHTWGQPSISIRWLGKLRVGGSSMPLLTHTHAQEKSRPASVSRPGFKYSPKWSHLFRVPGMDERN